ncbi:MAG: TonB-dependent receptor [Kiritimatiellia bacterium]
MKQLLIQLAPCLVCTLSIISAFNATAVEVLEQNEATPAHTNMPPVIVEASRAFKTKEEMASHVTIITAEDIRKKGRKDIIDVLRKDAGIFIRSLSSNPAQSQISMRGYGGNSHGRILVMVDGERLNNPDMAAPNLLRVPLAGISRIEVLHGSQTVLFGDYAVAGVINIITLAPGEEERTAVLATVGSDNTFGASVNRAGVLDEGVSYSGGLSWDKSDGYRKNSDYETWNANGSVTKHWNEIRQVSLSAFYHNSDFGLPGSLTRAQFNKNPKLSTTPNDSSELEQWGTRLYGKTDLGEEGILDGAFTASRRESETSWISLKSRTEYTVDEYAFTPKYNHTFDIGEYENQLTLGTDLRFNQYKSDTSKDEYNRASYAGYIMDEFFFTDDISLLAGARGERFDNRVKSAAKITSYDNTEAAYEAALLYRPIEEAKLFAKATSYYHAPFVDEVVSWGVPNTALKPETGYTLEAGGSATLFEYLTTAITFYQIKSQDEIYYNSVTYQNVNAPDNTTREGIEASVSLDKEDLGSIGLLYNYVDAYFSEGPYDENQFPMVPRHSLRLNGRLCVTDEISLLGTVNHISSQRMESDFANTAQRLKPYTTLDLGVAYEPQFAEGFKLSAGVDNLFDKEYCNYGGYYWAGGHNYYYYPADGRTWKVTASYIF